MQQQIRILLIDDHSLFRESLSRLLEAEPDFRIVATCADAREGLAVLEPSRSMWFCSISIWAMSRERFSSMRRNAAAFMAAFSWSRRAWAMPLHYARLKAAHRESS